MNLPTTQSTSYTLVLRPSMPPEYKGHLNLYMKEYRQQHKDSIIAAKNVIGRHIKTTSTCEKRDANIQKNIIAK